MGGEDESEDDEPELGRRRGRSSDAFEEPKCHFCNGRSPGSNDVLYCTSLGCGRVLCTVCVKEHFAEVYMKRYGPEGAQAAAVDGMSEYAAEDDRAGEWVCAVCRKICCCTAGASDGGCTRVHTHCRMYAKKQKRKRLASELGVPGELAGPGPRLRHRSATPSAPAEKPPKKEKAEKVLAAEVGGSGKRPAPGAAAHAGTAGGGGKFKAPAHHPPSSLAAAAAGGRAATPPSALHTSAGSSRSGGGGGGPASLPKGTPGADGPGLTIQTNPPAALGGSARTAGGGKPGPGSGANTPLVQHSGPPSRRVATAAGGSKRPSGGAGERTPSGLANGGTGAQQQQPAAMLESEAERAPPNKRSRAGSRPGGGNGLGNSTVYPEKGANTPTVGGANGAAAGAAQLTRGSGAAAAAAGGFTIQTGSVLRGLENGAESNGPGNGGAGASRATPRADLPNVDPLRCSVRDTRPRGGNGGGAAGPTAAAAAGGGAGASSAAGGGRSRTVAAPQPSARIGRGEAAGSGGGGGGGGDPSAGGGGIGAADLLKGRLRAIREHLGVSQPQFGAMLRPAHPVGQQTLSRWESGLCRVPNEVMARAQELLRRGLVATPQLGGGGGEEGRAEEKEGGVGEDGKYLASEYPYQEPMLGDSFQVSSRDIPEAVLYDPLKHSGDPDEDARLGVLEWRGEAQLAPKVTPSQLAAYLATVRALCTSCLAIEFSEETALSTLHTLEEDVEAALESLRAAVAWHAGDQATVLSAPPAVLMRTALWAGLRAEPGCTVHWKPGEVAALDASMLAYDRDLIAIHENTFAERPLKEVVWHYYRHGAFRRHQVAAQALGIPEPTVDSVVAGPLPLQ